MWCDGLIPEIYDLQGDPPGVHGRAYCGPSGQEHWQFTLLIGDGVNTAEDIDWLSLLPPAEVTGWLSPHIRDRRLVIEPSAAYPDSQP
ncbi:hypothetical protein Rhe02_19380 [Rhizocola hellebori]|uniref:Uncharacterized protein n=2 Tax=Rhizocola hellebori TaxID=1392758 RepID=A0A8J3Q527_9ACTN|nr:hypothetical protein Rhe02_19380 [Rhizocola hellebori]